MIILLAILLWIIGDCMIAEGRDWEESERRAERRHQELLSTKQSKKKTVRRELHDVDGRYAVEEVTEEE